MMDRNMNCFDQNYESYRIIILIIEQCQGLTHGSQATQNVNLHNIKRAETTMLKFFFKKFKSRSQRRIHKYDKI